MTRPFALTVRGEDHHHDRTRDAAGRTPADVDSQQRFLHESSTVIHALRDGRYRIVPDGKRGGWRDVKSRDRDRPDIDLDIPRARFEEGPDLTNAIADALTGASSRIHNPPSPHEAERLAQERHDAAFALIVRAVSEGSIAMDDPALDCVWIHAGTPWSRAVMHCRARTGIISSIPIEDGVLDPVASLVIPEWGDWDWDKMDQSQRFTQWKLIAWATHFDRNELPDPMQTLRELARAG